jgi:ABC-type transporter Mla subunit MlaD
LVEAAGRTEIDQLVNTMGSLLAGIDPSVLDEVAASIRDTLASDPQRLSRMLENADRALASIADATDDLDGLMATGETTLEEASRAIAVLQRRAEEAKPLLAKADRIFDDVGAATAEVPVTVKEARAALEAARSAMKLVNDSAEGLETVLNNLSEIDRFELRRILREDGILVRLRPKRIKEDDYTEPPK